MVDRTGYWKNQSYYADIIEFLSNPYVVKNPKIADLYQKEGFSAAQIGRKLGIAKSTVIDRLHAMKVPMRTKSAGQYQDNNYLGSAIPYGYQAKKRRLIPDRSELKISKLIIEFIDTQGLSANQTAQELERRKYKKRNGQVNWHHGMVLGIYRRWKGKI